MKYLTLSKKKRKENNFHKADGNCTLHTANWVPLWELLGVLKTFWEKISLEVLILVSEHANGS